MFMSYFTKQTQKCIPQIDRKIFDTFENCLFQYLKSTFLQKIYNNHT